MKKDEMIEKDQFLKVKTSIKAGPIVRDDDDEPPHPE